MKRKLVLGLIGILCAFSLEAQPISPRTITRLRPVVDGNIATYDGVSGMWIQDSGMSILGITNLVNSITNLPAGILSDTLRHNGVSWVANSTVRANAVGDLVLDGDLHIADDQWVGLAAAAGRIVFNDVAIDELHILNAIVGFGDPDPDAAVEIVSNGIPFMISSTAAGDGDWVIVDEAGWMGIDMLLPIAPLQIGGLNLGGTSICAIGHIVSEDQVHAMQGLLVGTNDSAYLMDVVTRAVLLGSDNATDFLRTQNTDKRARIFAAHYDNTEQPVTLMQAYCQVAINAVDFGGGTGLGNTATRIRFYTAADNVTVTGTSRLEIDATDIIATLPIGITGVNALGASVDGTGYVMAQPVRGTLYFDSSLAQDIPGAAYMAFTNLVSTNLSLVTTSGSGSNLVATIAGHYEIPFSVSGIGGNNKDYEVAIHVNEVEIDHAEGRHSTGAAAKIANIANGAASVDLDIGDSVTLRIKEDAGAATFTKEKVTFSIILTGKQIY